jgi:hypothetical protein
MSCIQKAPLARSGESEATSNARKGPLDQTWYAVAPDRAKYIVPQLSQSFNTFGNSSTKGEQKARATPVARPLIFPGPIHLDALENYVIAFFVPPPTRPHCSREGPHVGKWLLQ